MKLARLGWLGAAKEVTVGTYVPPVFSVPYTGSSGYEDMIASLRDESVRANDAVLQGIYQGPAHAEWSIDLAAYPDLLGHMLAATIGPDTVTAGASTTLSAATLAGATSISVPVSLPDGTLIKIDTGNNLEYALTDGAPTGTGPYTVNVTTVAGQTGANRVGLALPHASDAPVAAATTHLFKQSTSPLPTYSFTYFDTVDYFSCTSGRFSELQVKIDPKGMITLSTKAVSFPSAAAAPATPAYTVYDPLLGWTWRLTNGGAASSRGLTFDATIKRATEAVQASTGTQAPREVFAGAIEYDSTLKCIYENADDLNLYLQNIQQPLIVTAAQPVTRGGQSLTLTSSQTAWTKGKRDLGQTYAQADFSCSAVRNSTDGGVLQAVLVNWQTSAY